MVIHFETRAAAEADLAANKFKLCKTGRWVKDDIRASIHPAFGAVVAVAYEVFEV